jgi:hypothetical protein
MGASDCKSGTGQEAAPVDGFSGCRSQHEDLAAGEDPLLAGVIVPPDHTVAEQGGQVMSYDFLVPVVLQRDEVDRGRWSTQCQLLRKGGCAPWQEAHATGAATLEEKAQLDG